MKYLFKVSVAILLVILIGYILNNTYYKEDANHVSTELLGDKNIEGGKRSAGSDWQKSQSGGWSDARGKNVSEYNRNTEKSVTTNSGVKTENQSKTSTASKGSGKIIFPDGMTEDDIPDSMKGDLDGFQERLEDIRENDIDPAERKDVAPVLFSTILPSPSDESINQQAEFSPYQNRIFSILETGKIDFQNKRKILIKWYDDAHNVLMFGYMNIAPAEKLNYVWKEMQRWRPGIYTVDFYELDNDVRLLATGSYTVSDKPEYIGSLGTYSQPLVPYSTDRFTVGDDIWIKFNYSSYTDINVRVLIYEVALTTIVLDKIFLLPATYQWQKELLLGDYVSEINGGTYYVEIIDESGALRGRSIFYLTNQ